MQRALLFTLLLSLPASTAFAGRTEVTMYGAKWCGPCRAVKGFLTRNKVPFEYVDIDTERGRSRYVAARGSYKAIPLTVIGRQKILGANLKAIVTAFQQAHLLQGETPVASAGEKYGGHSPEWWQVQFRQLRGQLALMDRAIEQKEKVAADNYEKELLAKMKENREIVQQSIDQLEVDASNVSLPRKFRR